MGRLLLPTSAFVLCVFAFGCGDNFGDARAKDAGVDTTLDAGRLDAGADGSTNDDASHPSSDAQSPGDVGEEVVCSTESADGVCVPTAECGDGFLSVPGFCPGPADIQCCVPTEISPGECVENPAYEEMPRPNSGMTESPGDPGCPSGMTNLDTFCIDTWEAALVEVLDDGSERHWSPYFNPESRRMRAVSIAGAIPQAYINGDQAADACAEAGKRLCTDSEWLLACQGAQGRTFPYGTARQTGTCNDSRSPHPAVDYFNSTDDSIWSMLGNACIGQQDDTVDPAGANVACVTPEGVFDLMGNLHEWTADPSGTFRGGFYADTEINGPGCLYRTTAHNTGHWDYSTGFRCCADRL